MRGSRDVLSLRAISSIALGTVLVTATLLVVLLITFGSGSPEDAVRLTAVQTAGTIGLGAGGAVALFLAALRQRTADLTLQLQRVAESSRDDDARSRRVTDLYKAGTEQLGSDDAVTRLAGVYALERLADDAADQRQPVVSVLCAYLRMPFDAASVVGGTASDDVLRERTVRTGVQRVLQAHLRDQVHQTGLPVQQWPSMIVDLSRAELIDVDFTGCRFGRAEFARARCHGTAQFGGATFTDDAFFDQAQFMGDAWFAGAAFVGAAFFDGAHFRGAAHFRALPDDVAVLSAVARAKAGPLLALGMRDASFAHGIWTAGAHFDRPPRLDPVARLDGGALGDGTAQHAAGTSGGVEALGWPTGS